MKTGLVLEGGAMRGMFTAGVMDVMLENNIQFDGAVGVSAGAAFGCNYKSKQIGRVIRYNTKFCNDKRYCGMSALIKDGNIFSKDFCYNEVPLKYDKFDFETFYKNPMEFYVVCTELSSGQAVYHKYLGEDDHGFEWIRASASMPLVSEIVEIDGVEYLDGGVADSIPLKFFESIGYDRNIVVLTQPENYQKKKNKMMPFIRRKYKKYPRFIKAVENRHIIYNKSVEYIKQKEKSGEILVIRPPKELPVGRIEKDPKKLLDAYEIGSCAAEDRLEEIKEFLRK